MHAVRTGRERHVKPIVHDHSRARAAHSINTAHDQTHERTAVQVAFANLHEVNAGERGGVYTTHQRLLPRDAEPTAIRHQTEDGTQRLTLFFHLFGAAKCQGSHLGLADEEHGNQLREAGGEIDDAES